MRKFSETTAGSAFPLVLRRVSLIVVLAIVLTGCSSDDIKCWPFCGKSSSGVTDTTETVVDENPEVSIACTPIKVSEDGGESTCTLTLSKQTTKKVSIKTTYSGTATAGTDYSGHVATHIITAGKTSTSWNLVGTKDSTVEGDESLVVHISTVKNATEKGKQRSTITLTEGDPIIIVTYPDGGETFAGGTYQVTWTKSSSTGSVKIELYDATTTLVRWLGDKVSENSIGWEVQ
ncbi:uncharacterized protein METZ01_LOCUS361356, partial [marine metagenome]